MTNIVRAPFFVPRPSDDFAWYGAPVRSGSLQLATTEKKFFAAPGQVPTKNWNSIYTNDDHASYQPFLKVNGTKLLTLSEVKFFGVNGQAPTKNWNAIHTNDDNSSYQPFLKANGTVQLTLTEVKFFGGRGQAPTKLWGTFDEAATWQSLSDWMNSWVISYASAKKPSIPTFWQYNIDDPAGWAPTSENLNSDTLYILSAQKFFGAGGQVPTKRWEYDFDDAALWSPALGNLDAHPIQLLTFQKFYGAGGQGPTKQWHYDFDDASVWNADASPSSIIPLLTQQRIYGTGGQVPTKQWHYDNDDASAWQFLAPHNGSIAVVPYPFGPVFWKFGIDDHSSYQPFLKSNNTAQLISTEAKFYGANGQVPTKQWHYDIDEASAWQFLAPHNGTIVAVPTPFGPVRWNYNFDDASIWNSASLHSAVIQELTQQTFYSVNEQITRWFDEPSIWQWRPNLFVAPSAASPIKASFVQWIDDHSVWQWKSIFAIAPSALVVRATLFASYDEAAPWSGSFKSAPLLKTQSPIISLTWRFGISEDLFWRQTYPSLVKFIPSISSYPFFSGKWGMDIPQDMPSVMGSRAATILYIPKLLFKRIATVLAEVRLAVAPPKTEPTNAQSEQRTTNAISENRTANAPAENRTTKAPSGDT